MNSLKQLMKLIILFSLPACQAAPSLNQANPSSIAIVTPSPIPLAVKQQVSSEAFDKISGLLYDFDVLADGLKQTNISVNAYHPDSGTTLLNEWAGKISEPKMGVFEYLIGLGADVNQGDKKGNTPLHFCHTLSTCQPLLQHGANANAYNERGLTPLHVQIQQNNSLLIPVLLEYGAKVASLQRNTYNASDPKSSLSPLLLTNSSRVQRLLIDAGADLHTFGADLFHSTSDTEMIDYLLKKGIDVDIKDESKLTSLQTTQSDAKFVFLIENGADINVKNTYGHDLIEHLFYTQNTQVLRKSIKGFPPALKTALKPEQISLDRLLQLSARYGNIPIFNELIGLGVRTEIKTNNGDTLLHLAMLDKPGLFENYSFAHSFLNQTYVRLLNTPNAEGVTPLMLACQLQRPDLGPLWERHTHLIERLLQMGNVHLTDKKGQSALFYALLTKPMDPTIPLMLLKAGAISHDHTAKSPFALALAQNNQVVLRAMLQQEIDLERPLATGFTPLVQAVQQNHVSTLQLLVERGQFKDLSKQLKIALEQARTLKFKDVETYLSGVLQGFG